MVKYIMKPQGSTMTGIKINDFDTVYTYKGYALVNELYEDDEGFNKIIGNGVYFPEILW